MSNSTSHYSAATPTCSSAHSPPRPRLSSDKTFVRPHVPVQGHPPPPPGNHPACSRPPPPKAPPPPALRHDPGGALLELEDSPLELAALPQRQRTAGRPPPVPAEGRLEAAGAEGPEGRAGGAGPHPTPGRNARRPPFCFLTSRSTLVARRNCGLCVFIILRRVLRGAARFILLLLLLRPLPPRPAQPPPFESAASGAGALPPWRTSRRRRRPPFLLLLLLWGEGGRARSPSPLPPPLSPGHRHSGGPSPLLSPAPRGRWVWPSPPRSRRGLSRPHVQRLTGSKGTGRGEKSRCHHPELVSGDK